MKVLLSSIGSRGDVQPIIALALELRSLGHEPRLCVAPTEALKIPYVFAAYCPAVLPSPSHAPAKMGTRYSQSLPASANLAFWAEEEQSWNDLFRATLNEERAKAALGPVENVMRHIFTDSPWLAADPVMAPAGATADMQITQTGAWRLHDPTALPDHVEHFLANGEPPIYLGFGSMRAAEQSSRVLIEAVRALGLRSIVSQGWGDLAPVDAGADCVSAGDVAHDRLFARVAAVVHHGGAGTTTAAARAGRAQVIVPHHYDQYYWAHRVQQLGVGTSGPTRDDLTANALSSTLRECLRPEVAVRAQTLASRMELHGARIAAERLVKAFA